MSGGDAIQAGADRGPEGESAAAPQPIRTDVTLSRGFRPWLERMGVSLAFTTYQTGQLFLVGRLPEGRTSVHQQSYVRAMGLHASPQRLLVASQHQIWRLENILGPNERANRDFDRLYVPRAAQVTGDLDVHELALDRRGRAIFVATRFNCLATTSPTHGFKPLWMPPFVSKLTAEDRCHLNGLAMDAGRPAYVTAVSRSDMVEGWRDRRRDGGVLIDLADNRIVAEGLSMPHSPRVTEAGLLLLDSGHGTIARIDPQRGRKEDIAFCPGFLRGLAVHRGHAIVTVSKPREDLFAGLDLQDQLAARDGEAWCGVCIVDLRTGDLVEWLRLEGTIRELFDVAVLPDVVCPMAVGVASPEIKSLVSHDSEFGPLVIED
jgi:uncharacterized protein (TIGR03032 family)